MSAEKAGRKPLPPGALLGISPSDPRDRFPVPVTWARLSAAVTGAVIDTKIIWCGVHWVNEHNELCLGAICPWCGGSLKGVTEKGYFCLIEPSRGKPSCIVVPSGTKRQLDDLAAKYDGLYGLKLRFERHGDSKSSRVTVQYLEDWRAKKLPSPPNLEYWLPVLFRYDPPEGVLKTPPLALDVVEQQRRIAAICGGIGTPPAGEGGGK